MRLRRLRIVRFRGIKFMDWKPTGTATCLVGPGDAGKSTILTALEMVLSPRHTESFDDSDFFSCMTSQPFVVDATVCCPPHALLAESRFGLHLRGWNPSTGLRDEPHEGDHLALTIRLEVDENLEPEWTVVTLRNPAGVRIRASDRALLAMQPLRGEPDHHLGWGKHTLLSRLTEDQVDPAFLASAGRAAREASSLDTADPLQSAAQLVQKAGAELGVQPADEFVAAFDPGRFMPRRGHIVLADGPVPLRHAGTGTRRLLCMAMQRSSREGTPTGVALVDEVELGLEPHRLRHLLHQLAQDPSSASECLDRPHAFMTTHSPVAITELRAEQLAVVRNRAGNATVQNVPNSLQRVVRSAPDAFLARKILVCEGRTELGVCRALDTWWTGQGRQPFAYLGVVPVDGRGSNAPETASAFKQLGYEVALFGDSDVPLNPSVTELQGLGVQTVLWDDDLAIEQRISVDVAWATLQEIVRLAGQVRGEHSVRDTIANTLNVPHADLDLDPLNWVEALALRDAIGRTAKERGWFKTITGGELLGSILGPTLSELAGTDLASKIGTLRAWIDGP